MLQKLFTGLLTLILGSQMHAQNLSDISFGTDTTFEVVTWNIEWFPKNGSTTADSVAKVIESLDVDVIGLQEIDDTTVCRQMINNLPGYELFMDNVWFGGLAYVYKTSSVTIQSIYKIYDTSPYWNTFPRSPLVMELIYNGEKLILINNHFKCCGDGFLDLGNPSDEETRRYKASSLLKQYIDSNFSSSRVIVLGDLNDNIADPASNNVFQMFIDDSTNYSFVDMPIALGPSSEWSFPNWPSHLDHLLITNELFNEFTNPASEMKTIKVDDYLAGGLNSYDLNISDHRPVGLKIKIDIPPLKIAENFSSEITLFPNPSNDIFTLDLGKNYRTITIIVTDLNGKILVSQMFKNRQHLKLKLEEPPGVYFLKIEAEKKNAFVRLQKK